jgi:adenylate cyclase, class 2
VADGDEAGLTAGPRRNVELKARDPDPARSLAICRSLGAADHDEIWQRDTYFAVAHGRLKLREQRPGPAQLIHYERDDRADARESRYRITEVADAESLRMSLETALGIKAVVEKRRRLFVWQDVRIHLDRVTGLGAFIEFEAVAATAGDLGTEHERVGSLRRAFNVTPRDLVDRSYADLLGRR